MWNLGESAKWPSDLQDNLGELYKQFGEKFKIQFAGNNFQVRLYKEEIPTGIEFWTLDWDGERDFDLRLFKINFINSQTGELDNDAYIASIHRDEKQNVSGTDMVKLCLEICRVLGVKKVLLNDGAEVKCDNDIIDLAFVKLLEYNKTFYMKLGFDIEITNDQFIYQRYNNKSKLKRQIGKYLDQIRKTKVADVVDNYEQLLDLLVELAKSGDYDNFRILFKDRNSLNLAEEYYKKQTTNVPWDLFDECVAMLRSLKIVKGEFLGEALVDAFKNNCANYVQLIKYLNSNIYQVSLGSKSVIRKHVMPFNQFAALRYWFRFSYVF
jgi:hypothetical protein